MQTPSKPTTPQLWVQYPCGCWNLAPYLYPRDPRPKNCGFTHTHVEPYLSFTSKYILFELDSPGKSGSFFYFSCNYCFIVRTIRHSEHKFLLSILKDYHMHVRNNLHTPLSCFYGLHCMKLPRGWKIHFVIMNNQPVPTLEHNRDGDQPADHTGLNCGKPGGMGQKLDLIHSIHTQRIWIKGPVIFISVVDIRNLFGGQLQHYLLPYQSISVG